MKSRKLGIERLQDRRLMAGDIGLGSGMLDFGYGYDYLADPNDGVAVTIDHSHFGTNDGISVMMDWHHGLQQPPGWGDGGI